MRLLVTTWDGAGNLPPILALVDGLARRGHEVHVLGHDVQRQAIEAAGGVFVGFEKAPQWDQGQPGSMGADPIGAFLAFEVQARDDVLAMVERLDPAVVLIDCMLPSALAATERAGLKTVALVHALYSFFAEWRGGLFRAPIDESTLALGLTYEAFDKGAIFPPNLVFVGPARPATDTPEWKRRRTDAPMVVVGMSTGVQGREGAQQNLLQRVCDALAALDVEALVTTGRGIAPESLTVGANTAVERRVPHEVVLGQADLLVTHAGHGTVMAGLRFGVPMLCLPPGADQPFNAAKVVELRLGEALDPATSSEEIREAISRLLDDRALKERSRAFAAAVASQPGIEKAIELVESFAA